MAMEFFYDSQIRRYLIQVTRVFGQFSYQLTNSDGQKLTKTIPCTLASSNFNVAALTTNNTDNFAQTAPQFSVYMRDLQVDHDNRQCPNFERILNVTEREIDEDGNYTGNAGNRYTVSSIMPVPYKMIVTVYLWTTNMDQKCQILEQVLCLFNGALTLQSNTNPLDWTSLTTMELTATQWTNNSYPLANSSVVEVSALDFTIPIWINPPSKIKQQKLIQKIITEIGKPENLITDTVGDLWSNTDDLTRVCVTYNDYSVDILDGYKAKLINYNLTPSWKDLIEKTGTYVENKSKIIFTYEYLNVDIEISCYFTFTDEADVIDYTILNYPEYKYTINGIIDPRTTNPETKLRNSSEGDTYLIIRDINSDNGFNGLNAKTNDIIYFDGDNWLIKYSPVENIVIYNSRSKKYFIWTGENWDDIFSSSKKNIKWSLEI